MSILAQIRTRSDVAAEGSNWVGLTCRNIKVKVTDAMIFGVSGVKIACHIGTQRDIDDRTATRLNARLLIGCLVLENESWILRAMIPLRDVDMAIVTQAIDEMAAAAAEILAHKPSRALDTPCSTWAD